VPVLAGSGAETFFAGSTLAALGDLRLVLAGLVAIIYLPALQRIDDL